MLGFADARICGAFERWLPETCVHREVFGEGACERLEVAVEVSEVLFVRCKQHTADAQVVFVHELQVRRHVFFQRVYQQQLPVCAKVDTVACSEEPTSALGVWLHNTDYVAEQRVRLAGG